MLDNQKVDISVELSGSVEDVIYKNADNGYTVINLGCDEGLIAVVGNLGDVNEGERLSLRGGWITSPKYGRQFKAAMCERSMPETESEISAYLGSGVIKGLGPAIAKKIVKQFGTEALDIIDNDCMQLTVIKGITSDKALYISNEYHKITGVNEVIKFLGEYNFGPAHAISVWSAFEHDSIKQIKTNPYILCTSGIDIDFRSVDRMAADLGFDAENSDRVRAGIVYVLHENANAGHTCLPTEKLRESVCDNLGIERRQFESCLDDCEEKDWVVRITLGKREFVYLPEYYLAETYIAKKLAFMLRTSAQYEKDYSDEIRGVEFSENIQYEDLQRAAISACLTGSVFILTGGPGTGKTTTLNGVIKILKAQKKRILLCAPTGRAAKRMSDLTGEPARTIHRLLEVDFTAKGELKFKRNETNPLPADVVIADEMSMVDALLMCSLVRAIKPTSKFIMVGDSNQLPSVGAGNVLKDLIASHYIPSVELKEIFRQAAQSLIVTNAHRIVNGEFPVLDDRQNDFFFMNKSLESDIAELVIQLAKQRLPDTYGFSPIDDIQVLCPTKMGMAGTKELNKQLQSALNPPSQNKAELKFFDVIFRTGDKVMQTKNDYDVLWTKNNEKGSGIFNGDIGIIRSVDRFSQNVTIDFEGRVAIYTSEMLRRLEHAYAITIHKSQGSEYDAVIIPITAFTHNLLYRNLLYTGVTRAKKMIIVIGTRELVKTMVDNNRKMLRYSLLRPLLEIEMNRKDTEETDDEKTQSD
ncbi:MAG: ATP-dependent RecD-like DNA helicase [[Eubacterium] siraeum]|uniref:ATP-dependent RecD2 DNA helicase n=2 Tax=root TaxID=1 RepID=A0AAW6D0E1_9FIRM|nr:ATP-dependent RecD-like DNA helicase [[Eubacterium] siraeum]MDB8003020.1 ATP-dependent RecD-like DNA helicase [[Eubacterium] siraeum]